MTATHNRNTTTSFICITMTIQYWTLSMHSTKTLENLETVANGTEISKKTIKPGYSALTGRGRTGSMTGLLSARSWREQRVQTSLPQSSVLSTQAWYAFILVLMVNMVLSQTLFPRLARRAAAALPFVQFSVQGEVAENGGAQVSEVLHHHLGCC